MCLLLQSGDADLEELIDVLPQDRKEAHPLEQRERFVLRDRQHTLIEIELGELAVDVVRARRSLSRRGLRRRLGEERRILDRGRRNRRKLAGQ